MKSLTAFILLISVLPLKAEPPKAADAKDELKKFQGVWDLRSAEQDGQRWPLRSEVGVRR